MADSEGDSESELPPRDVCEERCQRFAELTATDSALAMFYLQDRDWDLQRALNAYYEERSGGQGNGLSGEQRDLSKSAVPSSVVTDPEPHRIRILSWNIDGLDTNNLVTRTKGSCHVIKQEKPDVVFLQEVVPNTQDILETECPDYQLLPGNTSGYYTAVMLRCSSVVYMEHNIKQFYSSKMGRNLLSVKAQIKGVEFLLMTSHLESTKSHAQERTKQLKEAFCEMTKASSSSTVVFGGDLNLRDAELAEAGGIPEDVHDLWEVTGKRPEAKFTWDTQRNENTQIPSKFRPRCRFDRLYLKNSQPKAKVRPVYFELVGIEKLRQCGRFPSDHWGILSHYDKTDC